MDLVKPWKKFAQYHWICHKQTKTLVNRNTRDWFIPELFSAWVNSVRNENRTVSITESNSMCVIYHDIVTTDPDDPDTTQDQKQHQIRTIHNRSRWQSDGATATPRDKTNIKEQVPRVLLPSAFPAGNALWFCQNFFYLFFLFYFFYSSAANDTSQQDIHKQIHTQDISIMKNNSRSILNQSGQISCQTNIWGIGSQHLVKGNIMKMAIRLINTCWFLIYRMCPMYLRLLSQQSPIM